MADLKPESSPNMPSSQASKSGSLVRKSKEKPRRSVSGSDAGSSIDESVRDDLVDDQIGKGVATAAATVDREKYLAAHKELLYEKVQLQIKNNILHRRLADYYKKRKLEHVLKPFENSHDLEEKYQTKLLAYEELKEKEEREIADINSKLAIVEATYNEHLEKTEVRFDDLQEHEKTTATGLIYSKKGKPISDKTVQRLLTLQRHKQEMASALLLRFIRARNAVCELESLVRKLEKLGPGLYVAHYEQLSIDNRNYVSKIEEREDELCRNRAKCTEHNQILAHIREKMHHTDEVIDFTECDFGDAETEFQRSREDLGQMKTRRNRLRWRLEAEGRKAGLLARKDLQRDFQESRELLERVKARKLMLETQIAKTGKELRLARKCINEPSSSNGDEEEGRP